MEIKKDKFKLKRGKYSRIINLHCRICKEKILVYQKDGPGNLRRAYFDRIFEPKKLTNLQNKNLKEIPSLKCKGCKEVIGTPYIYKKENRKAFKIYQDALIKL